MQGKGIVVGTCARVFMRACVHACVCVCLPLSMCLSVYHVCTMSCVSLFLCLSNLLVISFVNTIN